jgi:predicted esterase
MAGGASGLGRRAESRLAPLPISDVFSTPDFPPVGYPDPHYVEELVGPVTTATRFFDGQGREVSRADKPGRYMAKIDVTSRVGTFTTYRTLFRAPVGWSGEAKDAVTAAASFEGILTNPARPDAAKKAEQDRVHALRKHLGTQVKYEYEVKAPSDYEATSDRKWPLIVFLHGSGGGDEKSWPTVKLTDGPMAVAHREDHFPFIVVALRSPGGWFPPAVEDAIDDVESKYAIDKSRVYLAGFSMGGFGTWSTAYDQPSRFAAIAPVAAGSGNPDLMPLLKDVPAWVFNGGADTTTSPVLARSAVEALKRAGGSVRYTEYPGEGHGDALRLAFANKELYDWFLQFRTQ